MKKLLFGFIVGFALGAAAGAACARFGCSPEWMSGGGDAWSEPVATSEPAAPAEPAAE